MISLILAAALQAAPMAAVAGPVVQPPKGFDAHVEQLRQKVGAPGLSIAIVDEGQTVLAKGYGVRKLGSPDKVDADTLFMTGSTGKAFTTAALATLVDAGKLSWDDKVADRLPGFQMYDPWVTREMTVRDLLVHRSGLGLGQGDLLFVPRSNIPRAEAVRRLRYLKPATSFRSGYAYDNVLYMVAGQLIEAVSGQTWEDYTREHVLVASGMTGATTDGRRFQIANRAQPHARMDGGLRGAGTQEVLDERDELSTAAAPAGGMAVSANDMAKWLKLQLAHGALPKGKRLFSEAQHDAMWRPEVIQPIDRVPPGMEVTKSTYSLYALGWEIQDYRGTQIVWHSGAVFGFKTVVVLIPSRNVGFSIELNSEDGELPRGLMYELLDHYLDLKPEPWTERYIAYKKQLISGALKSLGGVQAKPAGVGPSLPTAKYAGTYADPWYGDIAVTQGADGLRIDFKSTPRMAGKLEHWQYDTFVTRFDDKALEPAYVTFGLDADGAVERVTMKPVSPIADFSWDYQDLLFTPKAGQP
jgi:CubicO group peptidase (beta-lactamase class C family)